LYTFFCGGESWSQLRNEEMAAFLDVHDQALQPAVGLHH